MRCCILLVKSCLQEHMSVIRLTPFMEIIPDVNHGFDSKKVLKLWSQRHLELSFPELGLGTHLFVKYLGQKTPK